ncbi:MAG: XdhC/CoxI family protein [Acidobacteriota bacterium]
MLEFYTQVTEYLRNREHFVVATVLKTSGSTPRKPGAKMIVLGTGQIRFTVGGGPFEALVIEDSLEALSSGQSRIREYQFREEGEGALGMVCGGSATVLMEVLRGPDRLLIFGGGHVGEALAEKASGMDFEIHVVEDRQEFLQPGNFPAQTVLHFAGPEFSGDFPEPDPHAFVCILTRCHRTDHQVLRRVIRFPAAYLGMIGSRRKARTVLSRLAAEGVPEKLLESVHSPIGLEIGGRTPAEIAVSILAQVVQYRNRQAPRERRVHILKPVVEV